MFNGYKCFDKELINRYGIKFEVGKLYHCNDEIKFGNNGNGFHVCERLEDTLRYFDAMDKEVVIAQVQCYGNYDEYEDDYNEYYDMYAFEYMIIKKILSREEIIDYVIHLHTIRVNRFISLFKLTEKEIAMFKERFKESPDVLDTIAYYQEGDKEVFYAKKKI